MENNRPDKILRGVAGEYLVAGELSKRGFIASISLRNTKGIDILVSNSDASKSVGVQVKTTVYPRKKYPSWILSSKAEDYYSDTLFYVFVLLKEGNQRPDFYIVPSKDVANHTKTTHKAWLSKLNRFGKSFNDTDIRTFYDKESKYLEKWDLLGLKNGINWRIKESA